MQKLFFFDFDGVICDSIDECFLASWIAYFQYYRKTEPLFISLAARSNFSRLRPFIRDGEDYLLIHELTEKGIPIPDQQFFDGQIVLAGKEKMGSFKEFFYAARNYILKNNFSEWCGLNRLYTFMIPVLNKAATNPNFYILSTKRPEYIESILSYNSIDFPKIHILYSGNQAKHLIIRDVLQLRPGHTAVFVDDQVDHLKKVTDPQVTCYLAAWGYVKSEWLQGEVPVLEAGDVGKILYGK